MAVQYQIFTRYMNPSTSKIITNKTNVKWYPNDFRESGDYREYQIEEAENMLEISSSAISKEDVLAVEEKFTIIKKTTGASSSSAMAETTKYYQDIINESDLSNPKFNMLFIYNGLGFKQATNSTSGSSSGGKDDFEIYYDRIQRTKLDPWFLHSVHSSLNSAMNTCKRLSNIFGTNGIKLGKIVPLDTFIEIV